MKVLQSGNDIMNHVNTQPNIEANIEAGGRASIFVELAKALTPIAPHESLRMRVLTHATQRPKHLLQAEEGEFVRVLTGVYVKQLRADAQTETGLWQLEPGAIIPAHGHKCEEECLVVSGSISYAGRTLLSGDFLVAAKNEHQGVITTATGAMLLIRGELRRTHAAVC